MAREAGSKVKVKALDGEGLRGRSVVSRGDIGRSAGPEQSQHLISLMVLEAVADHLGVAGENNTISSGGGYRQSY